MILDSFIRCSFICLILINISTHIDAQKVKSLELRPINHSITISSFHIVDEFMLINSHSELNSFQFIQLEDEVDFKDSSIIFLTHTLPSHKARYQVELIKVKRSNNYIINLTITNVPKKNLA